MKEALKLALEALESCDFVYTFGNGGYQQFDRLSVDKAITAIKQALVEPTVQELFASLLLRSKQTFEHNFGPSSAADWIYSDMAELMGTTPPAAQRQWVGLRSEQYVDIARAISPTTVMGMKSLIPVWVVAYARAIEAELKEKNT